MSDTVEWWAWWWGCVVVLYVCCGMAWWLMGLRAWSRGWVEVLLWPMTVVVLLAMYLMDGPDAIHGDYDGDEWM